MTETNQSHSPKVLIVTASAGGGHIQAAHAKIMQLKTMYSSPTIITRDLVIDWVGKGIGTGFRNLWNYAQRTGNVFIQRFIYFLAPYCDILLSPKFFFKTLYLILKHDLDYVIDTQPSGLGAMLRATYWASLIKGKHIFLEKMIIELPTSKITLYYRPLRRLPKKYLKHLHIQTAQPLLKIHKTAEEFWNYYAHLPESLFDTSAAPIRPSFLLDYSRIHKNDLDLVLDLHDEEEFDLIARGLTHCHAQFTVEKHAVKITLPPSAHITTLMLGTYPSTNGVKKYVAQFIEHLAKKEKNVTHYLFVFCSHKDAKNALLHDLHELIDMLMPFPQTICVLPLYFQDETVIAPLMARSQITITRSGAITTHELLNVAKGKVFIHSECKKPPFTQERLKKWMPLWEEGNAEYLIEKKGARLITPQTFLDELQDLL